MKSNTFNLLNTKIMLYTIEKRLKELADHAGHYTRQLESLTPLLEKLKLEHDEKIITNRFFTKHFPWENWKGEISSLYRIEQPRWEWKRGEIKELHLPAYSLPLEIPIDATAGMIKTLIEKEIENTQKYITNTQKEIKTLEDFDGEAFMEDLRKLYEKYPISYTFTDVIQAERYNIIK